MRYIIDRMEEASAVCEDENKNMINLPIHMLPSEIKEGDIISDLDGQFIIDIEATQERRVHMRNRMFKLFNK